MMSGAIRVRRRIRLRYESLTFSALANSAEELYSPLSSICRQRWARTTALTRAVSTLGAGDHGAAPRGVRICLRPLRWRKVTGMLTVAVSPSLLTLVLIDWAVVTRQSAGFPSCRSTWGSERKRQRSEA